MQITVLGAGVVGLTSAYYLSRAGHQVTVVDRHSDVAAETSHGNGGQLSYSYVAPLAGPGVLSKLPAWLMRSDSPVRLRLGVDLDQWRWCLKFALACTQRRSDLTTRKLLALSFVSRSLIHAFLRDEPQVDFDFSSSGKLVLHRDARAMNKAVDQLGFQRSLGCEQEALTADECVSLEPAIASARRDIAGGIYTRSEDTADCYRFCKALARTLRASGVHFLMNTRVDELRVKGRGHIEARSGGAAIDAEHIVVATGPGAVRMLSTLGLHLPIYPLKGYSLTYGLKPGSVAPSLSVTDFARKVVYARLGNRLRVAGMADLEGYSLDLDPSRLAALQAEAAALFPMATADCTDVTPWTGLRPATPEGAPIIGPTSYRNLWVNVGHGALGFTLAAGSAALLTSWFGKKPDPSLSGLFAMNPSVGARC